MSDQERHIAIDAETLAEIRRLLEKKHEEEAITHVGQPLEAAGE